MSTVSIAEDLRSIYHLDKPMVSHADQCIGILIEANGPDKEAEL
jgi:hypothetical protein